MRNTIKKFLISALLSLVGLFFPAEIHAQFLGYVSPQTVTSVPINNLPCNISGTTGVVPNLGQTVHIITVSGVSGWAVGSDVAIQIQGSNDGVNFFSISDTAGVPPGSTTTQTILYGFGYYPVVRVFASCQPTTALSFTVTYSGSSSTPGSIVGQADSTGYSKLLWFSAPANLGATYPASLNSLQPPYGNSLGTIFFQYVGGSVAGSTINVQTADATLPSRNIASFPVANNQSLQIFQVPAFTDSNLNVVYVSGGATAAAFGLMYNFTKPGLPPTTDPCASPGIPKSSALITAPATATTQIVPLSTNTSIYVCGFQGSQSAAGAFQWEYGTGASCAGGTTTLTGVETTLSGQPVVYGYGGTLFKTASGNALCVVTSVAGAFNGVATFVQQ